MRGSSRFVRLDEGAQSGRKVAQGSASPYAATSRRFAWRRYHPLMTSPLGGSAPAWRIPCLISRVTAGCHLDDDLVPVSSAASFGCQKQCGMGTSMESPFGPFGTVSHLSRQTLHSLRRTYFSRRAARNEGRDPTVRAPRNLRRMPQIGIDSRLWSWSLGMSAALACRIGPPAACPILRRPSNRETLTDGAAALALPSSARHACRVRRRW